MRVVSFNLHREVASIDASTQIHVDEDFFCRSFLHDLLTFSSGPGSNLRIDLSRSTGIGMLRQKWREEHDGARITYNRSSMKTKMLFAKKLFL